MCGIAGAYGQLSQNELKNMVKEMRHRGPDYSSYESIDNVHLGHARLSIIDLSSASNQPLWNDDNTACIIFNGEIYNFKALKYYLKKKVIYSIQMVMQRCYLIFMLNMAQICSSTLMEYFHLLFGTKKNNYCY